MNSTITNRDNDAGANTRSIVRRAMTGNHNRAIATRGIALNHNRAVAHRL